ncbi:MULTISPECIES: RNase A-like domain-containing protein [Streptomyces]|uniref:RNase A-like domain-containing protein n=1 Tax=Streptomyces TaxID=1883 RepID=UPI002248BADA|nr:RNase A-like domain-containing protein [Streptomyces sp. JHD 1]MCX2971829.1 hypothetical protein [Streptomyces sp. JHD 1]
MSTTRPQAAPADTPQTGGFDVQPSNLYSVSATVAVLQGSVHNAIAPFLRDLGDYTEAGGAGAAPQDFAKAYEEVAERFLEVYAKSVVSLGGAAVGFTVTANNYVQANGATDPKNSVPAVTRPEPDVIRTVPAYPGITPLSWNKSGDDGFVSSVLDGIETGLWAVFRPVLEHYCRWGDAADIMPLPHYLNLHAIAMAWQWPITSLGRASSGFVGAVNNITDQSNSEWYKAMRAFCSALWGTTAWGQNTAGYDWKHDSPSDRGRTEPVFSVLHDTAVGLQLALQDYSEAARIVREEMRKVYYEAVWDALPDVRDGIGLDDVKKIGKTLFNAGKSLSTGITLNLETAALEAAKAAYTNRVASQATKIRSLLPALEEAALSAPTFEAQTARSQFYGARSVREFKPEHHYSVQGESRENHFYSIDLASQEELHGSHVIDKHVGKSDEQLAQRLRDQPGIKAASTFPDLSTAQRTTQDAIDYIGPSASSSGTGDFNKGVNNPEKIEKWLSRPRKDNSVLPLDPVRFDYSTGRTMQAGETQAQDSHSVQVVLKYKHDIDPPFVVYTSMPTTP